MAEEIPTAGMTEIRLRAFGAAWNAQNIERVMSFFSTDCVLHLPYGPGDNGVEIRGQQAVRAAILASYARNPNGRVVETDVPLFARSGAVVEWYLDGATPQAPRLHGCDIYQFDGELIRTKKVYVRVRVPA